MIAQTFVAQLKIFVLFLKFQTQKNDEVEGISNGAMVIRKECSFTRGSTPRTPPTQGPGDASSGHTVEFSRLQRRLAVLSRNMPRLGLDSLPELPGAYLHEE